MTVQMAPVDAIARRFTLSTAEKAVLTEVVKRIESRGRMPQHEFRMLDQMQFGFAMTLASRLGTNADALRKSMEYGPLEIVDGFALGKALGVAPWTMTGWSKGEEA